MTKVKSLRGNKVAPEVILNRVAEYAQSGDKVLVLVLTESDHEVFYNDVSFEELSAMSTVLDAHLLEILFRAKGQI